MRVAEATTLRRGRLNSARGGVADQKSPGRGATRREAMSRHESRRLTRPRLEKAESRPPWHPEHPVPRVLWGTSRLSSKLSSQTGRGF